MQHEVYLDHSATTPVHPDVLEIYMEASSKCYGNPSSLHKKGMDAEKMIKTAKQQLAGLIHVNPAELLLTSGGTESNNLAVTGYLKANPRAGKHIVTSIIEHPSVLNVFKHLEKKGYKVDYVGVDENGYIDMQQMRTCINEDTALVSLMHVNNETGAIQPVEALAQLRKETGLSFVIHSDCVQSYGKVPLNMTQLNADMISASAHKINGPKGCGLLYIRKGIRIAPMLLGGGQQEDLRPGTENVPSVAAFGVAAELASKNMSDNIRKVGELKNMLMEGIKDQFENVRFNSFSDIDSTEFAPCSPYILNVSFNGVRAEVLLHSLEAKGIYISTGSACASHKKSASHVLTAMKRNASELEGAVRFSFSYLNTEDDICYTMDALKEIIPNLRRYKRR